MARTALLHQALLWAHLMAFAIAFAAVVRADLGLLRARRFDADRLAGTARLLAVALAVLWATGLGLLSVEVGPAPEAWLARPKTAAKLLVVGALTLNGIALHTLAFPRLQRADAAAMTLPALLGAISSASWLYAACIGAARLLTPPPRFTDYLLGYLCLLMVSMVVALGIVRPRLARMFAAPPPGIEAAGAAAGARATGA